jgi:glycosyltransferase involved in cell wall biosynthesis
LDREGLPDFQVTYAGSGPDLDEFKRLADESGIASRFRFLGFVDDTTTHLHESDVVVIPSVWGDAFPYAVLEALAAGKAVVASRAGGIPEEIGDPSCGVLVPPGNDLALANALERLLKEPELRHEIGIGAFRRASQRFREAPYFEAVVDRVFSAFGLPGSTRKRPAPRDLAR